MLIYDKMKTLIELYDKNPNDTKVINDFISENINPEPFITYELVSKCIEAQKNNKHIGLSNIKDENKVIACIVTGAYLSLDVFEDWVEATGMKRDPSHVLPVINKFLVPKYVSKIAPFCEEKVDFERELADYNPEISFGSGRTAWTVKLYYGNKYDSVLAIENLDKETLKVLKEKASKILEFSKKFDDYIEARDEFLTRTYHFLGDDNYQRRENGIYLDRANNIHKRHIMIEASIWTSGSVFHDFNFAGISLKMKVIDGRNVIAEICDKRQDFFDFNEFENVHFYDLDEAFEKIRVTVNSGFKRVDFMD